MSRQRQVAVPYPPHRHGDEQEPLRPAPLEPAADSYRHNLVRIHTPSGVVELLPAVAGAESAPVATLPGNDGPVHFVSGCNAFGRLVTQADNAATIAALHDGLDVHDWTWHRAAILPPGREWVETAAAIRGVALDEVRDFARYHGQEAVLTWDEDGLTVTPTGLAPDLHAWTGPIPVSVRPADPGCPMRFGDTSTPCVREGGPWVSRSMQVALVWEHHRHMLVDALGCSVCAGGDVGNGGGPIGLTSVFTPSRRGGWQWGPPLPPEADDAPDLDEQQEGDTDVPTR